MKKLPFLFLFFISVCSFSQDTTKTIKFAFSLEFGPVISLVSNDRYTNGAGEIVSNTTKIGGVVGLALELINGVSINDKYRVGVGTGYHFNVSKGTRGGFLPFYGDFRWIPIKGDLSPIIVQRLGGVLWTTDYFTNDMYNASPVGAYYSAGLGMHIRSKKRISGSFIFNYQLYSRSGLSEVFFFNGSNARSTQVLSQLSLKAAINF